MYKRRIDKNIIFWEGDVELSRKDQAQVDSMSESRKNEPCTSDVDWCLFHLQFKWSCQWAVIGGFQSVFYCS